jgi:hypothetical protein
MKMAVFWVVAPCSLVDVYRRFRDACCLRHQSDHHPDDGAPVKCLYCSYAHPSISHWRGALEGFLP